MGIKHDRCIHHESYQDKLTLQWRHDEHDSVSNHQSHGCLLNRSFGRRSKKTSKLRVTGLCAGNSPGPVNSPHKGPVTRKMFPFDDVIMIWTWTGDKHYLNQWWPSLLSYECWPGNIQLTFVKLRSKIRREVGFRQFLPHRRCNFTTTMSRDDIGYINPSIAEPNSHCACILCIYEWWSNALTSNPNRCLAARSREASKPRDSGLNFCRHLGSTAAKIPVKFQSDTITITPNLAASKLREIWR